MATPVKQFVRQSYRLISSNSPTVPLQGDDEKLAIRVLNQLLSSYASSGLLLTVAKTIQFALPAGQQEVTFGPTTTLPLPDVTEGRLAYITNAWLISEQVRYPLTPVQKTRFDNSYIYEPLSGVPLYSVYEQGTEISTVRLYPSGSKAYDFYLRGKFQTAVLTANDEIEAFPDYYELFLLLATARTVAPFKGRMGAWTQDLEDRYKEAKADMESVSDINLDIMGEDEVMLNGANRVRAGI